MWPTPSRNSSHQKERDVAGPRPLNPPPPQEGVPQDLLDRASAAHRDGRYEEAIDLYRRLAATFPDVAELHLNMGVALRQGGRPEDAVAAFDRARELAPEKAGIHYNRGNALTDLDRLDDAEAAFRSALEKAPDFLSAVNNLGDLLTRRGRHAEAAELYAGALATEHGHPELLNNLGNAFASLGRYEDAETHLAGAITGDPRRGLYLKNHGAVCQALGRWAEAESQFDRALAIDPDDADGHCLRAFARLGQGQYGDGWDDYRHRWQTADFEPRRPFPAPPWNGAALEGKRILIWGEQGIGDEIMFATMIPDLVAAGAGVTLECSHRLVALFERSFPDVAVVPRIQPPRRDLAAVPFDWQTASGDLGRYLRRDEQAFPARTHFLTAEPQRTEAIRQRYRAIAGERCLVGLTWRSGAEATGSQRSLGVDDLVPLAGPDRVFVNLQWGHVEDELARFENETGQAVINDPDIDPLGDMDAVAAQVAALDLVITAANTAVHVSGGLGIETWVLVPNTPDWRWRAAGDHSPWYPSVRLFRQKSRGDWSQAVAELARRL